MLSTPLPLQHLPGVQFKQWASYCDIFYVALKVAKKGSGLHMAHFIGKIVWKGGIV